MKRILMMVILLACAACGDETEPCSTTTADAPCTTDAECHTHDDPCRLNVCSAGSCVAPPVPDGQQGRCDAGEVCSSGVCVTSVTDDRDLDQPARRAHPR